MASSSEATLGAKIANAEKILTNLKSFVGYAPPDDLLSVKSLEEFIKEIKLKNNATASTIQIYSEAVDKRQILFQKSDTSLIKILPLISATVRASFGKTSKEAKTIATMVAKIRGAKAKKISKDATTNVVSQSEKSYGSMTQNFSDMIATLEIYAAKYSPINAEITIEALKEKLALLNETNVGVTATYGKQKENRDDRSELYTTLNAITQRVKDTVKSQYGQSSTEYKLIKGIKV